MDGNGSANAQTGFGTPAGQDSAYTTLDNYINTQDCLREQRGTLLRRNTCRNPWMNFLNARLAKGFNTGRGQQNEVNADVVNVLKLIGSGWGVVRSTPN